jgi:exodeoxyribonuclease-1
MKMLDIHNPKPLLHTSGRIPANRGCTSIYLPLAIHPGRPKSIIAIDLNSDPGTLISGSAEEISDLVFVGADDLPEGVDRIPLKAIHSNKVPMLAPLVTLKGVDTDRISLNKERCLANAERIKQHLDNIRYKVMEVFDRSYSNESNDPDLLIYGGDFFSSHDKNLMFKIRNTKPGDLEDLDLPFKDPRLSTMFFRYRARNYPDTLNPEEEQLWLDDRRTRLFTPLLHGHPGLHELSESLEEFRAQKKDDASANRIIDQLDSWYQSLASELKN